MKTVILAGGFGTRLSEDTDLRPKVLVEIGGRPIIWHIMMIYSTYGYNEFVVALGYKGEMIKEYFLRYHFLNSDLTVKLRSGEVIVRGGDTPDWVVHLVDTGLHTQTGGRLKRLSHLLKDGTFMMTYGDGVGRIDIRELVKFHKSHGRLATVTAVRPPARFGGLDIEGDVVREFTEKPLTLEGWINGGFFVLEPEVMEYIDGDEMPWEFEPMERLAREGQLMAYKHEGFWHPMDTLRDKRRLCALWDGGNPPWKMW